MSINEKISPRVFDVVKQHLTRIEQDNGVVILHAIESGSRAWGFPSPDSDYDVRFIYAHPQDWYLQLNPERDVIEQPIDCDLDIGGWDVRKAFNLANRGNVVVQEWMVSPIVYQQVARYEQLSTLLSNAFNSTAAYHHYRSMAKKAYLEIHELEQKKLKKFFYFARATLSAKWIVDKRTMPSIVFSELVDELITDAELVAGFEALITQKSREPERSALDLPAPIYELVESIYNLLAENIESDLTALKVISNSDFRTFLASE